MSKQTNSNFSALVTPENHILFSAVTAQSFQEIISPAGKFLDLSIVVADSLHYILALTPDLQEALPDTISWIDLIENGYVPPVAEKADLNSSKPHTPLSKEYISDTLIIHDELPTLTGRHCTMCDILDDNSTVLKLAVSSEHALTQEQRKIFLTLATTLHLAYFRLGTQSGMDNNRGQFLLHLIHNGSLPPDRYSTPHDFNTEGLFQLACFTTSNLGKHNLSFITSFSNFSNLPNMLSTMAGDIFVILFNVKYKSGLVLEQLDNFSNEHGFPIIISEPFSDLNQVRNIFREVSSAAILAASFRNSKGLRSWNDFALLLSFKRLQQKNQYTSFYHPDADILHTHDETKHTQYVDTVYCYLIHNCDAPATAAALFIHRNTLDKRLRKIEELITADWHSFTYNYRMLFSLFCIMDEAGTLTFYDCQ